MHVYSFKAYACDWDNGIGPPRSQLAICILACADAANLVWC